MVEVEGGYILLSRKLIESEIWNKPHLYLKVWVYILTKAQHKPYKHLDRGEMLISIPELIEACSYKVGYRTEKPTKSQIYNVLEWLRSSYEGSDESEAKDTMIDTTKTTRGMIVRVCNYNVYQDPKKYEHNGEDNSEDSTKETMPKRQADTINKNVKNVKNDKNKHIAVSDESKTKASEKELAENFEKLWSLYPNKKGKFNAYKSYKKAIKDGVENKTIQDGIVRYKKYLTDNNKSKEHMKHGSTFFSGRAWGDDFEEENKNKFVQSDKKSLLNDYYKEGLK